ncbi:hypothetical protein QJS66_15135 [Kocuria rhizophila]|nr:hypothetical protein QJS66_15135 [Kocuria rhizophila]
MMLGGEGGCTWRRVRCSPTTAGCSPWTPSPGGGGGRHGGRVPAAQRRGDGWHVMVSDGDEFLRSSTLAWRRRPTATTTTTHRVGARADRPARSPLPTRGTRRSTTGRPPCSARRLGSIQTFESGALQEKGEPSVEKRTTKAPHHGVALKLRRNPVHHAGHRGRRAPPRRSHRTAPSRPRPRWSGVHGEAAACLASAPTPSWLARTGPAHRDGSFQVPVKDAYPRSGNLAGSETSPIVLGDYKVDKDAEHEHPTRAALLTPRTLAPARGAGLLLLVPVPLAADPTAQGLALTYDGSLAVIDQNTGRSRNGIPVISPWQEKDDWQQPGPRSRWPGTRCTSWTPSTGSWHVVDLSTGTVAKTIHLPQTRWSSRSPRASPTGAGAASGEGHHHGPRDHGRRRTATEPARPTGPAGVLWLAHGLGRLGPAGRHG